MKFAASRKNKIVDVAEEKSRSYWAALLGVSVERLKSAVRATRSVEYPVIKAYLTDHVQHS
ncbi:MAG: DUF3606 domain-containing protein [Chitinophagaceae bacterium]|nr:MAG: DUF3606 domain-containing protein [Chitinophagaceae bacterium]